MNEIIFRSFTSIFLLLVFYFSYVNTQFFFTFLIILFLISLIEYSQLIIKINKENKKRFFYLLLGILYIIFIIYLILFQFQQIKDVIFYFILVCISTDIGGFVFGKIFKGKKLTNISPNKTYAGFYGSFILSFLCMFLISGYLNINFTIIVIFTFSLCLLSQFGDLFFSYLKRKAKVKDTGKLLPGHGGILDRIDGIIISVPINIFFYTL